MSLKILCDLAIKLKADLNNYVELAKSLSDADNRVEALISKLNAYTLSDLKALGNEQDSDELLNLLSTDMTLNAQGLDIWLSRNYPST